MPRQKVAMDGRPLLGEPLGVCRYLTQLLPELAEHVELFVLIDGRPPPPALEADERVHVVPLKTAPGLPGLAWLDLAVAPWLRRFDGVFHATFNVLPLTIRGPSVLTLHDLATQLHPEDFGSLKRAAWRMNIRAGVGRASLITTVSEFIKGQIEEYFGVDPERVAVAPPSVDPVFSPARADQLDPLSRRLGLIPPYIVAVGGAPRRGLSVALDAWRLVKQHLAREVMLVVVGQSDLPPEPGLLSLGRVSDEVWATLLAGAQALSYPTRYEGFGLPALEAAAAGTPVVCAKVASLPEVLGDAGCWAAAPTPRDMAPVLARLLTDPQWRQERREAGLQRARSAPSWRDSAAVLLDAYARAAA